MCLLCAIVSRAIGLLIIWTAFEYLVLRLTNVPLEIIQQTPRLQGDLLIGVLLGFVGLIFLVPALTRSGLKRRGSILARLIYFVFFGGALVYASILLLVIFKEPRTSPILGEMVLSVQAAGAPTGLGILIALFLLCFVFPGSYARHLAKPSEPAHKMDLAESLGWESETPAAMAPAGPGDRMRHLQTRHESRLAKAPQRASGTTRERIGVIDIIAALPIAGLLFVTVYGSRIAWYIPAADWMRSAEVSKVTIAIAFAVLGFLVSAAANPRQTRFTIRDWRVRACLGAALVGSLGYLFPQQISVQALPSVHSLIVQEPKTQLIGQVVEIGPRRSRLSCRYVVYVSIPGYGDEGVARICGENNARWQRLSVGDRIILSGVKTPFGFRYHAITARI